MKNKQVLKFENNKSADYVFSYANCELSKAMEEAIREVGKKSYRLDENRFSKEFAKKVARVLPKGCFVKVYVAHKGKPLDTDKAYKLYEKMDALALKHFKRKPMPCSAYSCNVEEHKGYEITILVSYTKDMDLEYQFVLNDMRKTYSDKKNVLEYDGVKGFVESLQKKYHFCAAKLEETVEDSSMSTMVSNEEKVPVYDESLKCKWKSANADWNVTLYW